MSEILEDTQALESTTVTINRTSATVKGGRRMSFAALVVVGDRNGSVGLGYAKSRAVPTAIEKAQKYARQNMVKIKMAEGTITHQTLGRFGSSSVKMIPAAPGTGVIAGGTVRAVLEMAGVRDCLTKSFGSTNKVNLTKAALNALTSLRTREDVEDARGIKVGDTRIERILKRSAAVTAGHEGTAVETPAQTTAEEKAEETSN